MRIHIVTNTDNGKGLERDYRLLSGLLTSFGHKVTGVHFQRESRPEAADLVIFLEVYVPRLAAGAPRRWLIPNAEWWQPEDTPALADFELVLCKTRDGLARFAPFTLRARHLGFFSEDRHDAAVPRERRFLHVAGGSIAKGTDFVLAAWERYRIPYPLTVVSSLGWARRPRNVEFVGRIDERRLKHYQNACLYHLCPSRYEGWGHVLHEGLSVGAAVVVPDTPALSDLDGCALRLPASPADVHGMVRTHVVAAADIRDAAERCVAFTGADLNRIQVAAREAFLGERELCIARLRALLGEGAAAPATEGPIPAGAIAQEEAEASLARAVRAVAFPALRGLYGGVLVIGEAAERIARDVVRLCGLATRVVTAAELAGLPANHSCGAILSNALAGQPAEEQEGILRETHRVIKAAGPIAVCDAADLSVRVEYARA